MQAMGVCGLAGSDLRLSESARPGRPAPWRFLYRLWRNAVVSNRTGATRIRFLTEPRFSQDARAGHDPVIELRLEVDPGWPEWFQTLYVVVALSDKSWRVIRSGVAARIDPRDKPDDVALSLVTYLVEKIVAEDPGSLPHDKSVWQLELYPDDASWLARVDPRRVRRELGRWYACGEPAHSRRETGDVRS